MDPKSTMVIIGWSFVTRDEVWYKGSKFGPFPHHKENKFSPFLDWDSGESHSRFVSTDSLRDSPEWNDMRYMAFDNERQVVHFFQLAFMFIKTLEQMGYKWLMFNAAPQPSIFYSFPYAQKLKQTQFCINHKNFHWDMSIPEYARKHNLPTKDTGHMLEEGHKHFVDWIIKKGDLSRP